MDLGFAGCFLGVVLGMAVGVYGQGANPPGNEKVTARFVADVDRVKPGGDFTLGVEVRGGVGVWGGGASPAGNERVAARFVAEVDGVRPGGDFTVGVEVRPAKGWHVYWKNPGEAGLPTTVSLKLPAGVTAEAWRY